MSALALAACDPGQDIVVTWSQRPDSDFLRASVWGPFADRRAAIVWAIGNCARDLDITTVGEYRERVTA